MRGRPILGAVTGLLFGVFCALDLIMFKVVGSGTPLVLVLPVLGLVGGIVLGVTAPFRRGRAGVGDTPAAPTVAAPE